jgi:hypothetical protein
MIKQFVVDWKGLIKSRGFRLTQGLSVGTEWSGKLNEVLNACPFSVRDPEETGNAFMLQIYFQWTLQNPCTEAHLSSGIPSSFDVLKWAKGPLKKIDPVLIIFCFRSVWVVDYLSLYC